MAYRNRPIVKFTPKGKRQRYKNLASFNSECKKRSYSGNSCILKNIRKLKDGGGLATVESLHPGDARIFHKGARPDGVWRLHFADYGVMKRHLSGRVLVTAKHSAAFSGARRRRR